MKYLVYQTKKKVDSVFGGKIAPIFFNTLEDSGAFPIELDVSNMEMGQEIILEPHNGRVLDANTNEVITTFELKTNVILDEVRANGRIPLIIGRQLTDKTREALDLEPTDVFKRPDDADDSDKGYTLAQKMVGKACGVEGIRPGTYCEPRMTTVGSQDTTGPMTRDELKRTSLPRFLCRSCDAIILSYCCLSKAS
jgi:aconitate hydratase 2/2-methylisocitrate dehydratase